MQAENGFERFCDRISKVLFVALIVLVGVITLVQVEKAGGRDGSYDQR